MYKLLLIVIGICLSGKMFVSAQQWTKKDSIWLKKVLSGKEKLELNPEAKKAIESGELINLEEPASHMKLAPTEKLPVTQDFSEYIRPDTIKRKVALKQLPPAVFWLYHPPRGVGNIKLDVAEMTSQKARTHKRNQKRNGTRKNYNNLPTPDIIKKKKVYAKQNPQLAGQDTLLLRKDTLSIQTK